MTFRKKITIIFVFFLQYSFLGYAQSQQWTWVAGNSTIQQFPYSYGELGVPNANNQPPERDGAVSWSDSDGNIFLFSGSGNIDSSVATDRLNDLWKYDGIQWTWIGGSSTEEGQAGLYGTKGLPDPANFPGARYGAIGWTDNSDNLWLFGGDGVDALGSSGKLNDLWKFDGSEWTWVSGSNQVNETGIYGTLGVASSSNQPGARYLATSWVDDSNDFWLFGGLGNDGSGSSGRLNDLWKFDGVNWTWMSGDNSTNQSGIYGSKGIADITNTPGARHSPTGWIDDSGNLWLFGGSGYDGSGTRAYLNDLWKFDGSEWTWISGSNIVNETGNYGTKGVTVNTNIPGARYGSSGWADESGNYWVFGGTFIDSSFDFLYFNDLWKFDGTDWTWVKGSNTVNQSGNYGELEHAMDDNTPSARNRAIVAQHSNSLYLFGGYGFDGIGNEGDLNDLWLFNGTDWVWIGGNTGTYGKGIYGSQGVSDATNTPGVRVGGKTWKDSAGNLWLFGGSGSDVTGQTGYLNDLWKFDGSEWTWVDGDNIKDQPGLYGTLNIASEDNEPGARSNSALIGSNDLNHFWLFGGIGYDKNGSWGVLNDLWKFDGSEWTWVSGSELGRESGVYGTKGVTSGANMPGARSYPEIWMDEIGDIWLFGGVGYDKDGSYGFLNDLWKFDGTDWTWISGSNLIGQSGSYGNLNVANAANTPGARYGSISWRDKDGDLLLFGGGGYDEAGVNSHLSDLWKFNGIDWIWIGGSKYVDEEASYGVQGVTTPTNTPGSRDFALNWVDKDGWVWLFGGHINNDGGSYNTANDLWKFDGSDWTWISGSSQTSREGNYGVKEVSSSTNILGARDESMGWIANDGNLWVFGGNSYDAVGLRGNLNDLWKFEFNKWYLDSDNDEFGDENSVYYQYDQPIGYVANSNDCDDEDDGINPNTIWYADTDGDEFGDANVSMQSCIQPDSYVLNSADCDDQDDLINPNTVWYADTDEDGFGDTNVSMQSCIQPDSYVLNADDCDDNNEKLNNQEGCIIVTSIDDSANDARIQLYPNPVIDKLYIIGSEHQEYNYLIYNISGMLILEGEILNDRINFGNVQPGVYCVSIMNDVHNYTYRVIKK